MSRMGRNGAMRCYAAVAALGLAVAFSGCARKTVQSGEAELSAAAVQAEGEVGLLTDGPQGKIVDQSLNGMTSGPMLPIYFDFDKSGLRQDQVSSMEGNWNFLKKNPQVRVRIEGNCDERGTAEYNLALGERRAVSARNYLINLGVAPERLEKLSLGEERPLIKGFDEAAMAQNRRADFMIIE